MRSDIPKVKDAVALILSEDENARNNDNILIQKVYQFLGKKAYIPFDGPRVESITRCRRKFQEEGFFLGSIKTQLRRQQEAKEMRQLATQRWYG